MTKHKCNGCKNCRCGDKNTVGDTHKQVDLFYDTLEAPVTQQEQFYDKVDVVASPLNESSQNASDELLGKSHKCECPSSAAAFDADRWYEDNKAAFEAMNDLTYEFGILSDDVVKEDPNSWQNYWYGDGSVDEPENFDLNRMKEAVEGEESGTSVRLIGPQTVDSIVESFNKAYVNLNNKE